MFASEIENGIESASVLTDAKFVPKMETSEPGATGCPALKLAEFSAARLGSMAGAEVAAVTLKLNVLDWPPSGLLTRMP